MSVGTPTITYETLYQDVPTPARATGESAGYDVCAYLIGRSVRISDGVHVRERASDEAHRLHLQPGEVALVPLGFKARLPDGYEAQVRIRSSIAFKRGLIIPNGPGTIDADYPDEWMVMLKNDSPRNVVIEHGERIAQIVLARYAVLEWAPGTVGPSTNRTGGIGST
ncbi:MAG: dUTP diphosphatase [Gemmatimonadaceae bacterium]|nr:dUTP diphosphatase [Gemmatimonadaceae bacterium]